ncbi:PAS domain S-box protein [Halorubrum sp. RMP-47]|uniref:histidine kinase n=1 Tax=Halorubrum miltondacostae TaxID=3076378 RepID=A0ABD5M9J6_9EURY
MEGKVSILHVDDERSMRDLTETFLERNEQFTVETVPSAEEGLERIEAHPPDCVVSDYDMTKLDGLEFLEAVREQHPNLPFILFTGKGSEEVASDAIAAGVTDYLQKSGGSEHYELLANRIHNAVQARREAKRADKQERFTSQALDTLEDVFYVLNEDGSFRRWNNRLSEITGYPSQELAEMHATGLFPENEHNKVHDAIETALTSGEVTEKIDLLTADGDRRPHEFRGTRLTDGDGEPTGIVWIGRDLTDRRQQERRFRALVEESKDIISVIDSSGRFQYQSPSVKHILGYDPDETVGNMAWDYIHPDDRDRVIEQVEEQVANPDSESRTIEYRARHADGSWRWMEANGNNQLDNPAVEGHIITSRDTTERKDRQQELKKYKTIVQSLTDAVYVVDNNGRFTYVNDEFVELVGYDRETIVGNTPSLIKDENAVDRANRQLGRLLSTDGPNTISFEVTIHPRTGDPFVCEDHMGVLPYDDEEFEGSVGVLRDITEQKEYEQTIEAENERLAEFTGIVSHDLQTPLGVVETRLELAQQECESDHLHKARDALDRSQTLIDDLLILAQEGSQVVEFERVELTHVSKQCWESVETDQTTLQVEDVPVINADRSRIKRLFENLYSNAVNHGGSDVTVRVGTMDDGFYVADTGSGIPESEQEAVFEAGYSTNEEGTGFGLRIVEEVADAHGWELSVTESKQGGARFEMSGVETIE